MQSDNATEPYVYLKGVGRQRRALVGRLADQRADAVLLAEEPQHEVLVQRLERPGGVLPGGAASSVVSTSAPLIALDYTTRFFIVVLIAAVATTEAPHRYGDR